MTGATQRTRGPRRLVAEVGGYLLGLAVTGYLGYAGCLAVFGTDTLRPPGWRDPEVPEGVRTIEVDTDCVPGACGRVLVLVPAEGQSPEALASELALTPTRRDGWRWYDPHSVGYLGEVEGDRLRVTVSY